MSTFLELQDRVLDGSKRAGLTDRTEVKSLINQVYKEMRARTRPQVLEATLSLTINDSTYSITNDFLLTDLVSIRHVRIIDTVSSQNYLLEKATADYILYLEQSQATSGGGMRWWAQDGLDFVRFYPAPSSTTTQCTITYNSRPTNLVADGDIPLAIPEEFHDTIVLGSLARSLRVWHPPTARAYHADFMQGLMEYRQWMNRQGGTVMAKGVVNPSRSNYALHDNSQDFSGMR